MKIKHLPIWYGKSATAYELQIGRLCFYYTYVVGDYWKWRPWRRIEIDWERD